MSKLNEKMAIEFKFIIKEIEGKGKGMIALKDIKEGEQIYAEKPLISINRNDSSSKQQIETQFNNLSELNRQIFLDLAYQLNGCKQDIFNTNSICNKLDNEYWSHLFPIICRVNHSCFANSHWKWNNKLNKEELIAAFNIKCGDEITANYLGMNAMLTYNIRSQILLKNWGFQCKCNLCCKSKNDQNIFDSFIIKRQCLMQQSQKLNEQCYINNLKLIKLTKMEFNSHPLYLFQHHFQALKCCIRSEKQNLRQMIKYHTTQISINYFKFMGENAIFPYNVKYWIEQSQ